MTNTDSADSTSPIIVIWICRGQSFKKIQNFKNILMAVKFELLFIKLFYMLQSWIRKLKTEIVKFTRHVFLFMSYP